MASFVSTAGVGLVSCGKLPCMEGLKQRGLINGRTTNIAFPVHKSTASKSGSPGIVVVKAEGQTINPEIRKNEEKVVDSVVVAELSKPLTPYCRFWRSGTFPLCDGSHVKHNKPPAIMRDHCFFSSSSYLRLFLLFLDTFIYAIMGVVCVLGLFFLVNAKFFTRNGTITNLKGVHKSRLNS